MSWRLLYTEHAQGREEARLRRLRPKAEELLAVLEADAFQSPPPFEKPFGDLSGACSRRITIQHRLVYQVLADERIVKVLRIWTHCE